MNSVGLGSRNSNGSRRQCFKQPLLVLLVLVSCLSRTTLATKTPESFISIGLEEKDDALFLEGGLARIGTFVAEVGSLDFFDMPLLRFRGLGIFGLFARRKVFRRSASRDSSPVGSTRIWQGDFFLDATTYGFATLVQSEKTGDLTGYMTIGRTSLYLRTSQSGQVLITSRDTSDFPPEAESDDDENPMDRRLSEVDVSSRLHATQDDVIQPISQRQLPGVTIVTVLAVVTQTAVCQAAGVDLVHCDEHANPENMLLALTSVEADLNTAMEQSGAANVRVEIVKVHIDHTNYDGYADNFSLKDLRQSTNGPLDYIHDLREAHNADLVTLITKSGGRFCGIANRNNAWSAVAFDCFGIYTFAHEIGHNFGCLHDRDNTQPKLLHEYAHGFRIPGEFRTIMAYGCGGGTPCPRIPYFSNDQFHYGGLPLGDQSNDNARMIVEGAQSLASFKSPPPSSSPSPVASPSTKPSEEPSRILSSVPTKIPTLSPSVLPTQPPTLSPSVPPSQRPTLSPSELPSILPTVVESSEPSVSPSGGPSLTPSLRRSQAPTTPTTQPSDIPSSTPSEVVPSNPVPCRGILGWLIGCP